MNPSAFRGGFAGGTGAGGAASAQGQTDRQGQLLQGPTGLSLSGRARRESQPGLRRGTTRGCPECPPRAAAEAPLLQHHGQRSGAGPGRGEDGDRSPGTGDRAGEVTQGPEGSGRPRAEIGQGRGCPRIPSIPRAPPHPWSPARSCTLGCGCRVRASPGDRPRANGKPERFPPR